MEGKNHGGSIINITFLAYRIPLELLIHYDASKGGVVSLTQSLAKELGALGIRVNAIVARASRYAGIE
jgi:NAD(P)-dependent dehydrogenase (short-subunit alcohol dehydrogenase family)